MKLTAVFGLATAHVEMADFDGRRALVIERFDRRWIRDGRLLRLPQKDLCQALSTPPAFKYESDGGPGIQRIARLLAGGGDPTADQAALLKANVVFWLLGATDGHAKTFSVFLRPGGRFGLTPLYDVLSAPPAVDAGQLRWSRFKLSMAVGTNRHYTINSIARVISCRQLFAPALARLSSRRFLKTLSAEFRRHSMRFWRSCPTISLPCSRKRSGRHASTDCACWSTLGCWLERFTPTQRILISNLDIRYRNAISAHTTLFLSNRSQAVRLPKAVAFAEGVREVAILRDGARRMIVPANAIWDDFFDHPGIDLGPRNQPAMQERDAL